MVRVVAHERGEIERDGQPATAVFEQILVTLVGFFRRSEAGELPHGVKLSTISRCVNSTRERRLAGIAEILFFVPVGGKIGLRVEASNGHTGDRREARVAMLVYIHTGGRADGPLGSFLNRGRERLLGPLFFGF
jgi:hypothetical protein